MEKEKDHQRTRTYVLDFDVVFQDKQTCGLSEEEKIPISFSKGVFVEGNTFKLAY